MSSSLACNITERKIVRGGGEWRHRDREVKKSNILHSDLQLVLKVDPIFAISSFGVLHRGI